MVMDLLESLLEEFSKATNLVPLKPDSNSSCLIALPKDGPKIQLEIDKTAQFLVIGSELGFIPPGRYRETIFKTALQANHLPHPRYGNFAYSQKADQLIMFELLPLKELNGEKIAQVYNPFVEKAIVWKDSIAKGDIPPLMGSLSASKRGSGGGMFGL